MLFVEPSKEGLKAYSHKARELLFLACSDLECSLKKYNFGKNDSMKDYVKLTEYIDLTRYKLSLVGYTNPYKCCPFENWSKEEPSKSISWYDAYNKLKHNRDKNFHLATLENCINAIAANIILFAVRYSPRYLYEKDDVCSNLIKSSLDYRIENSMDFYIPIIEGRSSVARLGLFVHVTAGLGEAGFNGHWTLELTCVQPIRIYSGYSICQIYFNTVLGTIDQCKSQKYQFSTEAQPSKLFKELTMEVN